MRRFARLFEELDRSTRTRAKLDALVRYFRDAPPEDAAWALWLLSGRTLQRAVKTRELRASVARAANLPEWLVAERYDAVGDLGETLALLLPEPEVVDPPPLHELVERRTRPLRELPSPARERMLVDTWARLDRTQRFLWHKIMLGSFRVGVARTTVVKALAEVAGVAPAVMAHRTAGPWEPAPETIARFLSGDEDGPSIRPYPFFLASPLEDGPHHLGTVDAWALEWKYDGIRAQLIRRGDEAVLWSRGEELLAPSFPEIAAAARDVPDGTVLDGELLAWEDGAPLPFALLQRRLNRRAVESALWIDVPVVFMAFDALELDGADQRERPWRKRRDGLEALLGDADREALRVAPLLEASAWEDVAARHAEARELGFEGLVIKRRDAPYGAGRRRGAWWKWKVDPHTVDAVLVYAQRGSGRRAGLFTDFTFAVWNDEELVPVAKAYSGLSDREFREVNRFIRRYTLGRHGPVHVVEPRLVFELAFERVTPSDRHKAGLALRFPRMTRWRKDKKPDEADRLKSIERLLNEDSPRRHGGHRGRTEDHEDGATSSGEVECD